MEETAYLQNLRRKSLEMRDRSLPLARAITSLNRAVLDLDEALCDPMGLGSDCGPKIFESHTRRMDRLVKHLGYSSLDEIRLHAEMRTTPGWVHRNLLF